jgi:hypothetical protein
MSGDWLELFDQEGVQFVVLNLCDDDALVEALRCQPGWAVDFEDEEAVIFARADGLVGNGATDYRVLASW